MFSFFRYKAGFFRQLTWLLWRSTIDTFRNPFELRLRLLISIILAILLGLLFLRLEYNQQAFQNISAIIMMLIINVSFSTVQKNADVISKLESLISCSKFFSFLEYQSTATTSFQRTRRWDLSHSALLYCENGSRTTFKCIVNIHIRNCCLLDGKFI